MTSKPPADAANEPTPPRHSEVGLSVWVRRIEYHRYWVWEWGFEGDEARQDLARNLPAVFAAARTVMGADTDTPVSVEVVAVRHSQDVQQRIDHVRALRAKLDDFTAQVRSETAELARQLVAGTVTVTDIGVLLGVSAARAALLADPDPDAAAERLRSSRARRSSRGRR